MELDEIQKKIQDLTQIQENNRKVQKKFLEDAAARFENEGYQYFLLLKGMDQAARLLEGAMTLANLKSQSVLLEIRDELRELRPKP